MAPEQSPHSSPTSALAQVDRETPRELVESHNAFERAKEKTVENDRTIEMIKAIASENGIHSKAWALLIESQPNSPFLAKIPPEIRISIFELCFQANDSKIFPRSCTSAGRQKKFVNRPDHIQGKALKPNEDPAIVCLRLILVCRQTYFEINGAALLYRNSTFGFRNHSSMLKYVNSINPYHKSFLTSLCLIVKLNDQTRRVAKTMLKSLACLPLKDLSVCIYTPRILCDRVRGAEGEHKLVMKKHVRDELGRADYWGQLKGLKDLESFELIFSGSVGSNHYPEDVDTLDGELKALSERVQNLVLNKD